MFPRLDSQLLNKQPVYFTFYRFARRRYLIACDCEYIYLASLILLDGRPHWAEPGSKQTEGGEEDDAVMLVRCSLAFVCHQTLGGIECTALWTGGYAMHKFDQLLVGSCDTVAFPLSH